MINQRLVLLLLATLTFSTSLHYHNHKDYHEQYLETQRIELLNWQRLQQLEARIKSEGKKTDETVDIKYEGFVSRLCKQYDINVSEKDVHKGLVCISFHSLSRLKSSGL